MVTPWEENQILYDIMDGLGAAIYESDADPDRLTSIKLNKLIYRAVQQYDLPITYSWYIYGASLSGGTNDVAVETVDVAPLDDTISPDEPSIGENWEYPSPEEYKYFYKRDVDLEEILRKETKSYIRSFYSDYAPEEYEELYRASATLQKSLDRILDDDYESLVSEFETVSETVREEIRAVDTKLLMNENIEEDIEDAFTSYSSTLIEAIDNISGRSEISKETIQYFKRMIRFFYSNAWKYVALSISEKTATGPSRRDLVKGAVNDIDAMEKNYTDELIALREISIRNGLLPDDPVPSVEVGTSMTSDIDDSDVEAAFDNINSRRESRDYESIDPEKYAK
jgi:hypothetical protein